MERTGDKEDADACILRVKYMLDGQYVEICPLKGTTIRFHWNACIGKPEQARKFPGEARAGCLCWLARSRLTAPAAGSVPRREMA